MVVRLMSPKWQDGAFDEYVKDVDAVEHTASPFQNDFDDPQEAIVPAVHGTTSIIKSVITHGCVVSFALPCHRAQHAHIRPARTSSASS
jgi:hypothetical protein